MRLFTDDDFEFSAELVLGSAYYRAADVAEVLATTDRIKNGDYESWCREWWATAERVEESARACESAGRSRSAHDAWLRASNYWFQVAFYVLGTKDSSIEDLRASWRRHRDCFEAAARMAQPAWERLAIPYEGTELEGWLFRGRPQGERAPLLILNNGSDGTVTDMWIQGAAAGTERGYHCLTFDGPGQGQALFEQGLYFRPDWEAVIGPVVDYATSRDDVDPERIALRGVSQAATGYRERSRSSAGSPPVWPIRASSTSPPR
jgi:Esterase FrsA-like